MRTIRMSREIAAPVDRCFRLALSVDLQAEVLQHLDIRPVGGTTHGLLGENGTVVWRTKRIGFKRESSTLIETYRAPLFFREIRTGAQFVRYTHDHHFATMNDGTLLREEVRFALPWRPLQRYAERKVIRQLVRIMKAQNDAIQLAAESQGWRAYLKQ